MLQFHPLNDVVCSAQFSRNWFLERIQLLCEDILTSNEKSLRESIRWTKMSSRQILKDSFKEVADATKDFLVKGVTLLCHTPSGSINESTLSYNPESRRLVIKKTGGLFQFATQERGVNISDIFSLRPGTHSYGFVQSKSQNEKQENVCGLTYVFCHVKVCVYSNGLLCVAAVHVHNWIRVLHRHRVVLTAGKRCPHAQDQSVF